MIAGRGDGIDLDSPERWLIENLKDPVAFFRHIDQLIPADSILYFEGTGILPEIGCFYEAHRASNAVPVCRDTIFPAPQMFHVAMTAEVVEGIIGLLRAHPREACFNHVKAYRNEELLFAFHDAFDGSDFLVADRVPEQNVQAFCSSLGAGFMSAVQAARVP